MDYSFNHQILFSDLPRRLGSSTCNHKTAVKDKHHWTKQQTGSRLSLLEAILLYVCEKPNLNHDSFKLTELGSGWKTANEIRDAREHGTLSTPEMTSTIE